LRWFALRPEDAESIVANPISQDLGTNGNPRYLGFVGVKLFRVAVAKDDPDLIVSIHPRRHL
jgi:hypothetical protein